MGTFSKERTRTCNDFQEIGGIYKMELQEYKEIEYELKNSTLPKQTVSKIIDICQKQVGKSAVITGYHNSMGTEIGYCPNCNDRVLRACDHKYCPTCGYKLLW